MTLSFSCKQTEFSCWNENKVSKSRKINVEKDGWKSILKLSKDVHKLIKKVGDDSFCQH